MKAERDAYQFEVIFWKARSRNPASVLPLSLLSHQRAEAVFGADRQAKSAFNSDSPLPPLPDVFAVGARDFNEASETLERLNGHPSVECAYVAPPRTFYVRRSPAQATAAAAPVNNWGIGAIGLPLDPEVDASAIRVGVLDTGVDEAHPHLANRIFNYTNETAEGDADFEGHGTHVCGILAGGQLSGAALGVSNAALAVVKGLSVKYSARAYYRALRAASEGVGVLNLSLGGPDDPTETMLIERAQAADVVVVAAMGNEYEEGNPTSYPAALPGVVAVGAVDQFGIRANFSNTGSHISLVAPGVGILSTVPIAGCKLVRTKVTGSLDGTSMATPFVAGVIALVRAKRPELNAKQVVQAIKTTFCPHQQAWTEELGHGMLNARATLASL